MIEATNITRTYVSGEVKTPVLKGIDLHIKKGEFVSIMGRSGAGKSTLMYQLSLLDEPDTGKIMLNNTDVSTLSPEEKTHYRLTNLGYVFQEYALLPDLTALENVAVPMLMQGRGKEEAYRRAEEALVKIDLAKHIHQLPSQLSGGEQQRVSVARAIVNKPDILFADEPTANLDKESAQVVLDAFKELNDSGQTIVMVTHEMIYGEQTDRIVYIDDGKVSKREDVK